MEARTQLSIEIEEGRAAALFGLPESANPYKGHYTGRLHECAANWASGWASVAPEKRGSLVK